MSPYRKILVAYDGSEGAQPALERAAALGSILGAELHALWISAPPPSDAMFVDSGEVARVEAHAKHQIAHAARLRRIEEVARSAGAASGVEVRIDTRPGVHAAVVITAHAVEGGFDLIILGSEEHAGPWERVAGHTSGRVTHDAACDVLVVHPGHP